MEDTDINTILSNNSVLLEEKNKNGSPLRIKKVGSNENSPLNQGNANNEMKEVEIEDELKNRIDDVINKCAKDNKNEMNLWKFHMGDNGMRYFCAKLQQEQKQMSHVKEIDLQTNDLTSRGISLLCNSFQIFPKLEKLEIGINPIEVEGIKILSNSLHLLPKLQKLGLGGCNIGDDGIEQLSLHLKEVKELELLNIQNNNITDKGLEVFCKYIDNIPKLFELSVQENEISNNGIELLAESVMRCEELQILSYYDNKMNNGEDMRIKIISNHPNKEMCIYVYEDEIHAELDKMVEDTLRSLEYILYYIVFILGGN